MNKSSTNTAVVVVDTNTAHLTKLMSGRLYNYEFSRFNQQDKEYFDLAFSCADNKYLFADSKYIDLMTDEYGICKSFDNPHVIDFKYADLRLFFALAIHVVLGEPYTLPLSTHSILTFVRIAVVFKMGIFVNYLECKLPISGTYLTRDRDFWESLNHFTHTYDANDFDALWKIRLPQLDGFFKLFSNNTHFDAFDFFNKNSIEDKEVHLLTNFNFNPTKDRLLPVWNFMAKYILYKHIKKCKESNTSLDWMCLSEREMSGLFAKLMDETWVGRFVKFELVYCATSNRRYNREYLHNKDVFEFSLLFNTRLFTISYVLSLKDKKRLHDVFSNANNSIPKYMNILFNENFSDEGKEFGMTTTTMEE